MLLLDIAQAGAGEGGQGRFGCGTPRESLTAPSHSGSSLASPQWFLTFLNEPANYWVPPGPAPGPAHRQAGIPGTPDLLPLHSAESCRTCLHEADKLLISDYTLQLCL